MFLEYKKLKVGMIALMLICFWPKAFSSPHPPLPFSDADADIEAFVEWGYQERRERRSDNGRGMSAAKTKIDFEFSGTLRIGNCSGAIIHFAGQSKNSPAYVLTAGHCVPEAASNPGQVIANRPARRSIYVLMDKDMNYAEVESTRLVYALSENLLTISSNSNPNSPVDMAIYQIEATYNDLLRFGVKSFQVSDSPPAQGDQVDIISGFWMRGYGCAIAEVGHEIQGHLYERMLRYSWPGCQTIARDSGAPTLKRGQRTIVGIVRGIYCEGPQGNLLSYCTEEGENGIPFYRWNSLGQETYHITSCLNSHSEIDLSVSGCQLLLG